MGVLICSVGWEKATTAAARRRSGFIKGPVYSVPDSLCWRSGVEEVEEVRLPELGIGVDDRTNGDGRLGENDFERSALTERDNAEAEGAGHATGGADDGEEPGFGFVEAIMMTASDDGKLVRHTEFGGDDAADFGMIGAELSCFGFENIGVAIARAEFSVFGGIGNSEAKAADVVEESGGVSHFRLEIGTEGEDLTDFGAGETVGPAAVEVRLRHGASEIVLDRRPHD